MAVVLGIIVTIVVGLLALGVIFALVKVLLRVVVAVAAVGFATLAGGSLLAVVASLHGGVEPVFAALAGGGLSAIAAAFWARTLFEDEVAALPTVREDMPKPFIPPEPEGDDVLRDAWASAESLLPDDVMCLREMRLHCARALRAAKDDGMDQELRDVAVRMRNRLPSLIADTERLLADAERAEREDLRAQMLRSLEALSKRAKAAAEANRAARREALDLLHTHVRSEG